MVSSGDTKEPIVYYAPASIEGFHPRLQAQPEGEATQDFQQNTSKGPHVENESNFREVRYLVVILLGEFPGKVELDLGWQVLWS